MRPTPVPRGRLRAALASAVAVAALVAATVVPVAAVAAGEPGPIQVPALSGLVTNACTGFPILRGVTVSVSLVDPAAPVGQPPGPPIMPSAKGFGAFTYATLVPGATYLLNVSAPGYTPLGADPAAPAGTSAPGVTLMMPPGPPILPAGQSFATGLLLDIRLKPPGPPTIPGGTPGTACRPPGPPIFPAISGRAVDAATGRGLTGLAVGVAPLLEDPTTGMVNPGPIQQPPGPPNFGFFVFRTLDPAPIGFQFYAAAPGHASLGGDIPGTLGGSPGVTLMKPPGPPNLPAGTGSVNVSLVLAIALPAVQ
jgi:hypothetical protein